MYSIKNVLAAFLGLLVFSANASVDIQSFFPFGPDSGDQYLAPGDDTSSARQALSKPFNFFNVSYSSLWVNVNGAISFATYISTYTPSCQPVTANYSMISPFWADVDTQYELPSASSGISFRESTSSRDLQQAKAEVLNAFKNLTDINLTWAYIVTYNNVTFYRDDPTRGIRNTFQVALTSNGVNSFAIFYYNKIQWTTGQASNGDANGLGGTPAQVGFDAGDGVHRAMLDVSCTADVLNIGSMSNAGKPGVFVYQVDGAKIATPAPVTKLTTTPSRPPPTSRPATTTLSPSSDPRSDAIGSTCSDDVSKAWLDIVFVVDTSNAISKRSLLELSGEIATFMNDFPIGQNGNHTTRAAIVTYATNVETRYNLIDVTNKLAFQQEIFKLQNYANPDDNGGNIQGGLQKAYGILQDQGSFRKAAIILIAAAYNPAGFQDPTTTANTIKADGIDILTISFDAVQSVLSKQLQNISSPGYSYISTQEGLYLSLPYALTQVNCFCPPNSIQLKIYDADSRNYTSYADCLYGDPDDTLPSLAGFVCGNGVLASVTSKEKQDFISDYVVPHELPAKKKWQVGLHRAADNTWKWYDYDGTEYALGSFPSWGQTPAAGDSYSYMWQYLGLNVKLMPNSNTPLPLLCQSRACDASFVCDQSQTKKKLTI